MKQKSKTLLPTILWVSILVFVLVIISFPKWIVMFYPQPHRDIVLNASYEYKVDPYLVFAIIRAESKFQTGAESAAGARGLMQIMPDTAEWIAGQQGIDDFDVSRLNEPELNIKLGSWYIADLMNEFDNNLPLVIAAYNAGRGTVNEWLASGKWDGNKETMQNIPYEETRLYVDNVLKNYEAYQAIYT